MVSLQENKHQFALFVKDLSVIGQEVTIQDQDTVHRISHVLRLSINDVLTVFNDKEAFVVTITAITKKLITVRVVRKDLVQKLTPLLTVLLPVLKKEALEEALYACVELGVTHIILMKTAKSYPIVLSPSYRERLQKIIHGAQEQGKQFMPITFEGPLSFDDAIARCASVQHKIVALQGGHSLIKSLSGTVTSAALAVGPEADFTQQEKESLHTHGFKACSLGPTVLRAQQAVTVLVGSVRVLTV